MKALVSTPLQVYLVDLIKGKSKIYCNTTPEYYGISWDDEDVYLGHSNTDCYDIRSPEDYKKSEVGTVSSVDSSTKPFLSAPHQLVWSSSFKEIIATNTGRNCLSTISKNLKSCKNHWFEKAKWDRLGNNKMGSHLNSVYIKDNLIYAVGHNHSNPSKVIVLKKIDNELSVKRIYQTKTEWAHNVWVHDNRIIVCNSKYGELVDIKNDKVIWKEKPIVRGLSVTKDYIIVGHSAVDGSRKARKYSNGSLYIIDRKSLKTLERVPLLGSGCINEVRVIDEEDEAHFGDEWIPFPKSH